MMDPSPSFEAITDVMARASIGHLGVRVDVGAFPDYSDPLVDVALMLNVLLEDLEYRKRESEEALQLAAEAETRAQFLATMSHEIRTPMSVIIGNQELLSATPLDARQRGYVDEMKYAGDHLRGVIDDTLDMSRIHSGALKIAREQFDLGECLDQAIRLVSHLIADKTIDLVTHLEPGPRRVVGDAQHLRQVFVNLLSNAIKYTDFGTVEVTMKPRALKDGRIRVDVAVRDTGFGMDPAEIETIFEPFAQGRESIARGLGGTGLGLPITKHLVEAMGGAVHIASKPGVGTTVTFCVMLEATDVAAVAHGPDDDAPHVDTELRVLVVDDHDVLRDLEAALLRRLGVHHITTARNGFEAIDKADPAQVDVVLMDVNMPGLDGHAATREIRRRWPGSQPHIVAVTAHALDDDRQRSVAAGMNDFVTKPFDPERIAQVLSQVHPAHH
ncbi:MAG: hybrid sensor histidine kinase/response regulator [Thermoleophilia bacterium]|jgi:signal transduction histidine kinase/ActR/RegA family two-component response regulator|nr:hybrid sensor histidine kinase/response regulator [Thermoleophilia bacterium]